MRFFVVMKCVWKPFASRGCADKSTDIPAVLFSPQWAFAQNFVEQQTTKLPYKLRGNQIGSWGRSSPLGTPKEKLPYNRQFDKEPSGVRKPPRFRQANSSAPEQAFAQRPTGFAVYGFHTCQQVKQQACLLLFCNLFSFKQRKKLTVSPFQRDKPPALSADKEKTYPIGRQSSRFFLFPEKRTP